MTTTVLAYIPSPAQGVWHLGPFPLRAYALFIIVGIVAALVIGDRRWVARGGEPGVIYDVALWAVPFGLIGGRLYHVLTDWPTYFGENGVGLAAAIRIWDGGLGIWGAVALGGIGAWIACRRRGIPLPAFGDAIAPGIVLAQAIGRLGNYFNQELYGRETTLPWGLEIYERVNSAGLQDSLNGVSTGVLVQVVHPTFLYELLWNLLVFAVLILVDRRFKIGHGRLFALYVAGYCVGRFWIELMRSDAATLLAGIRINTFTSTFVFVGAVVYIMVAPKGREAPETLRGTQDAESDVEGLAKDVAMASATGVVAAATVAGREEDAERESGGLGAVEGDEAVEAVDGATAAHDKAVEGAAEAEALAADLDVPGEDSDAERAELDGDVVAPPVPEEAGGLGAVEGDEAVEAVDGATAAHDKAVEGAAEAEALAADLDVPGEDSDAERAELDGDVVAPPVPEEAGGLGAVEGDEAVEAVGGAAAAGAVVSGDESDEAETAGLGAVEGDEVAGAVADAPEAHESAVEGEEAAEELATDAEAQIAEVAEVDADSVIEADGLGAVHGDEVAAAVEDAPEVHEAAVEDEAAESDEPAAEVAEVDADAVTESESDSESEGLGSVEGEEVAAAIEEAPEVHEAAVEGEAEAEELAAEVDAEAVDEFDESDEPAVEVAEVDADAVTESDAVAESDSDSESEGLGSVEGDEVAAAAEDAAEVHEAAVEGEAEAQDLAAEVDAEAVEESDEPAAEVAEVDADAVTESEAGGTEVEPGTDESGSAESDVEGEPESPEAPDTEHSPYSVITESSHGGTQSESGGFVRQWLRRRRNR